MATPIKHVKFDLQLPHTLSCKVTLASAVSLISVKIAYFQEAFTIKSHVQLLSLLLQYSL